MSSIKSNTLTPLQLELLRSFSMNTIDESDLVAIKRMLSEYFLNKATSEAQRIADEKGWSAETVDDLAKAHNRTPYLPQKLF